MGSPASRIPTNSGVPSISHLTVSLSQASIQSGASASEDFLSVASQSPTSTRSASFQRRFNEFYPVNRMAEILAYELDSATFEDPLLPFSLFPKYFAYQFTITHELRDSLTVNNIPSSLKEFFSEAIVIDPQRLPQ